MSARVREDTNNTTISHLLWLCFGRSVVGNVRADVEAVQRKLNGFCELFGHVPPIKLLHPKPLQLNDEHVGWLPHSEHLGAAYVVLALAAIVRVVTVQHGLLGVELKALVERDRASILPQLNHAVVVIGHM